MLRWHYRAGWGWWFRLCGYGLHLRDTRNPEHFLLFSERNGLRRLYRFGPFVVKVLRREG
jgi:hypothetical protein